MDKAEKYDRELQLEILNALLSAAPKQLKGQELQAVKDQFVDEEHFVVNMLYLKMHKLITDPFIKSITMDSNITYLYNEDACEITEKGIDFLLDDGGLGAILKVQTVRFHSDTIIAIEDLIALSNLPEPEKASVVSKLRELPADAIKHLTNELISKALMAAPAALPIIQKFLQQG